ncbi:SGNH/GDSL hydrolase family protein [Pseudonocardia acaciae]|uniref:SGNH/GDSL hydrolase family protein n=1 Tax=Pseudonocardia acaciae TaxID=551276 RepID=UPI000A6007EB|nr:SGNH/GDSL hydrolase family protein [Pseudonocardia acaciae]
MRVRALVAMVTATAACLIAGSLFHPPTARAQECTRPRGPLVAYGHSYLLSPQLGGATASYATLAATALQLKPVIRAVNGGTTANVDKLVHSGPTRWVPGTTDLVVIDSAINDIEEKVPTARWTASLRHTLSAFATRPVPEILLLRPLPVGASWHPGKDPKVIANYAAEQRRVASEFSAVRIVDASDGWNPKLALSLDGIHPNAVGELHIARAVQRAAQSAFCRS